MKILKSLLILVSITVFVSCEQEANEVIMPQENDEKEIQMAEYNTAVINQRELITNFCIESQERNYTRALSENNSYNLLKENLLGTAEKFVADLELTDQEIEDYLECEIKTKSDKEDAIVALLMFSSVLDICNSQQQTYSRAGSFKDCFLEATGITAGAALIGNLSKGMMSKAMLKTALKMVAKIGGKAVISGAALALTAGEIIWCMS